jgi:hypothetical protein
MQPICSNSHVKVRPGPSFLSQNTSTQDSNQVRQRCKLLADYTVTCILTCIDLTQSLTFKLASSNNLGALLLASLLQACDLADLTSSLTGACQTIRASPLSVRCQCFQHESRQKRGQAFPPQGSGAQTSCQSLTHEEELGGDDMTVKIRSLRAVESV